MFCIFKSLFSKEKCEENLLAGRRILTIEDEATQRMMIQKTLEKQGCAVLTAEDGEKGLEVALDQKPDLILLDIILPGMHGDQVCRRLKGDARTRDIPVIFLTSTDTPKDIIEQYDIGGEIHLTKPIRPKELVEQIKFILEGK